MDVELSRRSSLLAGLLRLPNAGSSAATASRTGNRERVTASRLARPWTPKSGTSVQLLGGDANDDCQHEGDHEDGVDEELIADDAPQESVADTSWMAVHVFVGRLSLGI